MTVLCAGVGSSPTVRPLHSQGCVRELAVLSPLLSILSLVHIQTHVGKPQGIVTSPGPIRVEEEEKRKWTYTKAINKSPLLEPCET